ncbi:hypothetical protein [Kamptonema formosum]|uniref:hypothetical protein n=1 Tax=Kamptonema formosum TaxID=331992 RepID=UPI000349CE06|nr:hypothetical protein [Oscillatoria sp. PCC 10802]
MRIKTFTGMAFSIVNIVVGFVALAPSSAAPLPEEARLTQAQVKLLQSLGVRVAAPAYVPAGFRLEKVQAELARSTRVGGIGYSLIYQKYDSNSGKNLCFAIEATNGGIGSLPNGESSYPVKNPVLGSSTIEYGRYSEVSNPTLLGNWMGGENGPFYRFAGAGAFPALSRCENISPQEAVRVSESLVYLP